MIFFVTGWCLPGPASINFQFEGDAQEQAQCNQQSQHKQIFAGGFHCNGMDDISSYQKFQADEQGPAQFFAQLTVIFGVNTETNCSSAADIAEYGTSNAYDDDEHTSSFNDFGK